MSEYLAAQRGSQTGPRPARRAGTTLAKALSGAWAPIAGAMLVLLVSPGCAAELPQAAELSASSPDTFTVPDSQLSEPLRFIVYGDMRFTDPSETHATSPGARMALVTKIASEPQDALFLTGDIPWHGVPQDYQEYLKETAVWRDRHLRVYPVLGNHEFQECAEQQCLESWWQTFPELRGRRWYAVALGSRIRVLALDSNSSLLPRSEQRLWLEQQIESLAPQVRFVILALHHPPVADQGFVIVRRNEASLAHYLSSIAPRAAVRFIVCAGHVHNYERFERDGVLYLVSGGGGAKPLPVYHAGADFYHQHTYPNFHYIRFQLQGNLLSAEMVRLEDYKAAMPHTWRVRDRFEVLAKGP